MSGRSKRTMLLTPNQERILELVKERDDLRAENEQLRQRLTDAENAQVELDRIRKGKIERRVPLGSSDSVH